MSNKLRAHQVTVPTITFAAGMITALVLTPAPEPMAPTSSAAVAASPSVTRTRAVSTPTYTWSRRSTYTPTPTPTPTGPVESFGEGTYLVGTDIVPGTYRATVPGDWSCYWERASNASGSLDSIIANDNVKGQAVVTIADTDKVFTSSRCGTWTKAR